MLGIPHGAIDNILFQKKRPTSNAQFIMVYLAIVLFNILVWLTVPVIAYILFILFSAYHFGQSQFSGLLPKDHYVTQILNFLWGITVLSGLICANLNELLTLTATHPEAQALAVLHQETFIWGVFWISLTLTTALIIYSFGYQNSKIENLFMELIVLGLILASFYVMPLLVGFTLYFVILHSYKVLREEYFYLKQERIVTGVPTFVKLLTPYSAISIGGIIMLFGLIYLEWLNISYGYCLLIIISSITLPHVFVMDQFYSLSRTKHD